MSDPDFKVRIMASDKKMCFTTSRQQEKMTDFVYKKEKAYL